MLRQNGMQLLPVFHSPDLGHDAFFPFQNPGLEIIHRRGGLPLPVMVMLRGFLTGGLYLVFL